MSMESIGAKIAFVRGGFGSGEMQKEGEITISRYLTSSKSEEEKSSNAYLRINQFDLPACSPADRREGENNPLTEDSLEGDVDSGFFSLVI